MSMHALYVLISKRRVLTFIKRKSARFPVGRCDDWVSDTGLVRLAAPPARNLETVAQRGGCRNLAFAVLVFIGS